MSDLSDAAKVVTIERPEDKIRSMVVKFPVFDYRVQVEVGDLETIYRSHPETRDMCIDETESAVTIHLPGQGKCFIFLHAPYTDFGTIAHESCHAVLFILRDIRAKFDHEIVSYHVGYLAQKIAKWLMNQENDGVVL